MIGSAGGSINYFIVLFYKGGRLAIKNTKRYMQYILRLLFINQSIIIYYWACISSYIYIHA